MGHLINPIKFRLGVNRVWESTWSFRDFSSFKLLYLDDLKVMEYLRWFFFQKFKYRKVKKWRKQRKSITFLRFVLWKIFVLYEFLIRVFFYWNRRKTLKNKLRITYGLFQVSGLTKQVNRKHIRFIKKQSKKARQTKKKLQSDSFVSGAKSYKFQSKGFFNPNSRQLSYKKNSAFNWKGINKNVYGKRKSWSQKFTNKFLGLKSKWRLRKRRKRFITKFLSTRKQKRLQRSRLLLPLLNSVSFFHTRGASEIFIGLDHGFTLNLTKNKKKGKFSSIQRRLKKLSRFYKQRLRRSLRWRLAQYAYKYKVLSKNRISGNLPLLLSRSWGLGRWERRSMLNVFLLRADRMKRFLLFLNSFCKNLVLFAIRRFFYDILRFRVSVQLTRLLSKDVFVYFFLIHPNFLNARVVATHMLSKLRLKGRLTGVLNEVLFKLAQARESGFLNSFKIQCSGRFTRKERATFLWESRGPVSYSNAKTWMDYSQVSVPLRFGTGGIKVWLRLNYTKGNLFKVSTSQIPILFFWFKKAVSLLSISRLSLFLKKKKKKAKHILMKRRFMGLFRRVKMKRRKSSLSVKKKLKAIIV